MAYDKKDDPRKKHWDKLEEIFTEVKNSKILIGHNTGKLDEIKDYMKDHSGEGDATTHGVVDKRLSSHSKSINLIVGAVIGIPAIVGIIALVVRLVNNN